MNTQTLDQGDNLYSHYKYDNKVSQKPHEVGLPKVTYKVEPKDDLFKYHSQARKVARIAWLIFSILVFPVGILRLIGKVINHFSTKFGFVPGVTIPRKECDKDIAPYIHERCFKRIAIETADNVKLDTGMIENPNQVAKPVEERKYIIFFNGNAGTYERMMPTLLNLSEETGANVFCGNYRGVGYSEGFPTCVQDLVMDGEAMVQYLLSQGVQPQNILIHGWSLGGGVGAHVASLHQEKGREIHFCSDRSFYSMVAQVREMARYYKKFFMKGNFLFKCLGVALNLAPLATPLIHLTGWDFKSFECYKKINGHKFIIYDVKDEVVVYLGSLHKKLKDAMEKIPHSHLKHEIQLNYAGHVYGMAHCTTIDMTKEFNTYQAQVALALG